MRHPKVSVVVCTRNRAGLLPSVISRLITQDFPHENWEIIIVNNASTDNTSQIANDLIISNSQIHIRYVLEPRPGVTHARNRGAEEAKFPYVAYLDDDCIVQKDWLYQLMRGFEMGENIGIVGGLVLPEWENKRPQWLHPDLEPYFGSTAHLGSIPRLLEDDENVVEFNMAIDYKAWQAAGGFLGSETFGIDHLGAGEGLFLYHRLREVGYKIFFNPFAISKHLVSKRISMKWLFRRFFWQGAGDAFISALKEPNHSRLRSTWGCIKLGAKNLIICIMNLIDKTRAIMFLAYTMAFIGRLACEIHLIGNWTEFRTYLKSPQHQV